MLSLPGEFSSVRTYPMLQNLQAMEPENQRSESLKSRHLLSQIFQNCPIDSHENSSRTDIDMTQARCHTVKVCNGQQKMFVQVGNYWYYDSVTHQVICLVVLFG